MLEVSLDMPGYAKFMKNFITKKRVMDFETIEVTHNYSGMMSSTMAVKKEDSGAFAIPCTNGVYKIKKALGDL